jgi:hypothetical protein
MKMSIRGLVKVVSAVVVVAGSQMAMAQTTDTQRFTVTVPSTLSITGPADQVLTHDATNNDQVFSPGALAANHWQVLCNSNAGATVNLTTNTTNYVAADNNASVQATSAQPGKATLALTVTFITNTYSTLLQGDYQIDVVGTIAAN